MVTPAITACMYTVHVCVCMRYRCLLVLSAHAGAGGLLIHCISGWDRTPLFISLLRISLWAVSEIHGTIIWSAWRGSLVALVKPNTVDIFQVGSNLLSFLPDELWYSPSWLHTCMLWSCFSAFKFYSDPFFPPFLSCTHSPHHSLTNRMTELTAPSVR